MRIRPFPEVGHLSDELNQGWRFLATSVIGSAHVRDGKSCQDVSLARMVGVETGQPTIALAVADGAGSAVEGAIGAAMACSTLLDAIEMAIHENRAVAALDELFYRRWLADFQLQVAMRAAKSSQSARDFSTTVLAAVIGDEAASFLQIGDGAIVVGDVDSPDSYCWVFWPEAAEYANVTYFATAEDAAKHMQISVVDGRIPEVALFTDGLQRLALHLATKTAHAPFFKTILAPLRNCEAGPSSEQEAALAAFLSSEAVLQRTDDDKSLALATRRPAVP